MQEKLKIKLNIAGKPFSLTIDRDKEEIYRRAEKEANHLFALFESQFRGDTELHLAMTALQLSLNNVKLSLSRSLGKDIDALTEMESRIDDYFSRL